MEELVQQNKKQVLLHNKNVCSNNIQTQPSSLILQVPLILNEKGCVPFWNKQCQALQSTLWLPHKIVSQDRALKSSEKLLNYQVEQSNYWSKILAPKKSLTQQNLLDLSLPSVIAITENALLKSAKIIATKKIRIYPKNIQSYKEALSLYRRSYNIATSHYIENTYKNKNLRMDTKSIVKQESIDNDTVYNSLIADNGVLESKTTFNAVIKKNKGNKGNKGGFSSMSFKNRKGSKHSFKIDRLPKHGMPFKKDLGEIIITEKIPEEAKGKTAIITCDKNRWFLNVQQHIIIKPEIQGKVNCVAIDQGVRTFATTFSKDKVAIIGEDFAKTKLFPLMKKVDQLISHKQKILNQFVKIKWLDLPQWAKDRMNYCDKNINKLKCKKEDLITDLHHKFAYYLVNNFDCVFLPTFETKQMVKRKSKIRTIRRNTARQMLDLGHYKFKLLVKWYAKKYGKKVIDCNESHTSKTRSWNGTTDEKLGGKKIIKDENVIVNRDINGARNIFIKCLTRQFEP
jgi:putative transposase